MATLKKYVQWFSLGATVTVLAACSSTGSNQAPVDGGMDSGAGAKVSGLGDNGGFGDSDSKFGSAGGGLKGSNMEVGEQTYYFDFDKSAVHEADKPSIQVQANYLIKNPNAKLLLEGYTDPRGSREYNIALGERRGNAVADVLKADGVNPAQVRVVSYGSEKLASQGHTEADYALDRRVHLLYVER
ncbi:MAG: pal [Gammaproteobacteria bacterium]|jgi:peptidoglycan-associated lipoprotein|nr:pal [Gammaproteobacteria bacterium]